VIAAFTQQAALDWSALEQATALAVRFMDNVIDLSRFPFEAQARQARGSRRIGLGLTGLADCLAMLGVHYGSRAGRDTAASVMQRICNCAYRTSIELAREKGRFPFFAPDAFLESPFVQRLPRDIRDAIALHGLRNSHLTAIAPTGTISLFAGNVSSGIEPVFEFDFQRRARVADGEYTWCRVTDYAVHQWRKRFGGRRLPAWFVDARALPPAAHLGMQAALQPWVDSAISKTVNVPRDFPFEQFRELYRDAFRLGLKGCTTFRPNEITGAVLSGGDETPATEPATHCCSLDREGD
jgi:ribonucleoside-diphosphate reductase alpha chain